MSKSPAEKSAMRYTAALFLLFLCGCRTHPPEATWVEKRFEPRGGVVQFPFDRDEDAYQARIYDARVKMTDFCQPDTYKVIKETFNLESNGSTTNYLPALHQTITTDNRWEHTYVHFQCFPKDERLPASPPKPLARPQTTEVAPDSH